MSTLIEHDDVETVEGFTAYEESDESKAFREFKSSFDDEKMGTLRVHRVPDSKTNTNKAAQKTIYLFSCTIDQFDFDSLLEYIRDKYRGGTYRIIGSRAGHAGVAFNRLVEIETPIDTGYMGGLNKPDPLRPGDNPGDVIDRMGAVLLESQTRLESMFTNLAAPSTGDAFDQMTKMVTAISGVLGALGIKPGETKPQPTLSEQVKEMMLLKKFIGDLDGSNQAGEANIYSLLGDTIRTFGGPLAQAIAMGQDSGALNAQGLLTAPNPAPELTAEQIAEKEFTETMKKNIAILIANAENGVDAKQFAEIVVNNTPEDKLDDLYNFLSAEDFLERLIAINPAVETHKNWFTILRDTVIHLLTEPDDETIVPEAAKGQAETVAGDAITESAISDTSSDVSPNPGRTGGDESNA